MIFKSLKRYSIRQLHPPCWSAFIRVPQCSLCWTKSAFEGSHRFSRTTQSMCYFSGTVKGADQHGREACSIVLYFQNKMYPQHIYQHIRGYSHTSCVNCSIPHKKQRGCQIKQIPCHLETQSLQVSQEVRLHPNERARVGLGSKV